MAYYEKIVLKLNDLASMVVHNVSWSDGRRAFTCARDKKPRDTDSDLADAFKMNSFGLDNRDVEKEIAAGKLAGLLKNPFIGLSCGCVYNLDPPPSNNGSRLPEVK